MINWIDTETSGLSADVDQLLQIALVITDDDFNEKDRVEFLIWKSDSEVDDIFRFSDPSALKLHLKTGLLNTFKDGESLEKVDEQLSKMISRNKSKYGALGGNTVGFDRPFINKYLPKTAALIGYQYYDVSSIRKFFKDVINANHMSKKYCHTALEDILESIEEAKYYRDILNIMFRKYQEPEGYCHGDTGEKGEPGTIDSGPEGYYIKPMETILNTIKLGSEL